MQQQQSFMQQATFQQQMASAQAGSAVKVVMYDVAGRSKQFVVNPNYAQQVSDICEQGDLSVPSHSSGSSAQHSTVSAPAFGLQQNIQVLQPVGGVFPDHHSDNASVHSGGSACTHTSYHSTGATR